MPTFFERLQHGWNAFRGRDRPDYSNIGPGSYHRPDRKIIRTSNERSIITAIYNRIAMDVSANKIEHVKVDENDIYVETIKDYFNDCLTLEANIDQTSRAFFQDVVLSMFDEGCVAIVPTQATLDPSKSSSYIIQSMRVGKIVQWYPRHVKVEVYDDLVGQMKQLVYKKEMVAIIENPFYSVMNEPNSILQRLIRKLNLLDAVDEQSGSGKLDLIIQLPYVIKSKARREQAELRRKDIESQLSGSKYGIAYTDGTEHITQLNRPVENNLMSQIEYLMNTLYSQLGITPEILNGTANEATMLNYNSRTIEPILSAIVDEMKRKFLTKTARTQGHSIIFSSEPFKLVPISKIADIAEKFVANEILTPNELRSIVGFKPADDERANELRNRRLNEPADQQMMLPEEGEVVDQNQNDSEAEDESQESTTIESPDTVANMTMSEFKEIISNSNTT